MSFSFDKVTTGTYNFVSFIWNSNPVGETMVDGGLLLFFSGITISVLFLPTLLVS